MFGIEERAARRDATGGRGIVEDDKCEELLSGLGHVGRPRPGVDAPGGGLDGRRAHAGDVQAKAVDEGGPTRLDVERGSDVLYPALRVDHLVETVLPDEVVHVVIAAIRPLV